mmetsp:Transcript_10382/g.33580  ORF Transcript_10382/g.33580 Transcript_10382/m.33580 type:complete len:157 (+) Transcript_10382:123-593(+)
MMQAPGVMVLNQNTKRDSGKQAQKGNIQAAKMVADIIRTTLGPRSMLKMLLDAGGGIVLTNDGNAILREIDVAHPAAKVRPRPRPGAPRWGAWRGPRSPFQHMPFASPPAAGRPRREVPPGADGPRLPPPLVRHRALALPGRERGRRHDLGHHSCG